MSESKRVATPWVDPDDAPELTDEFFDKAVYRLGDQEVPAEQGKAAITTAVRRGRPKATQHKEPITLRMDPDALALWRASGKGWQTRAAQALAALAPKAA